MISIISLKKSVNCQKAENSFLSEREQQLLAVTKGAGFSRAAIWYSSKGNRTENPLQF